MFRKGDVRIDRATEYGNPFEIGVDGNRDDVIRKFSAWLHERPEILERLRLREPTRLVCWCAPRPCHGDVYADALAELPEQEAQRG